MKHWPSIAACLLAWATASAACHAAEDGPSLPASAPPSYERDIQPILARCVQCHGPGTAKAGLRLDQPATATAELDSGARAIVPGHPDQSELLHRVKAEPGERMPLEGPPLSEDQIQVLERWIAAGADWPVHWAYRPLRRPALPPCAAEFEWSAVTEVDRFVLAELAEHGLRPSPPADKRTLLRRVTFDLTGLAPTPDEQAEFLADDSPDAYARVVERLLASPHYGERWARHWMDIVHYAETHGHDQDRPRPNAWPYRDYLIRSFNDDKPYSRFVAEQVAGDVLFPGDPQALVATGFLATGPWDESSLRDIREDTIDREIARYLDRDDIVATTMSTFASSTVHCARCHDHKFDPISQREYYGLQAVFAATDKADRPYDPDPEVGRKRRALNEQLEGLPALAAALDPLLLSSELHSEIAAWEESLSTNALSWTVLEPVELASSCGATLTKQPDGSVLSGGTRPEKDTYTLVARTSLKGITGVRLELLGHDSLPKGGPGRQDNGNLHLNELTVSVAPADEPAATAPVKLANPRADFDQEGWTVAMALDGNPATAWGIHPEVGKPHVAVFEVADLADIEEDACFTFKLEQTHGSGHLIGCLRLSLTNGALPLEMEPQLLPAAIVEVLRVPAVERTPAQRAEVGAWYLRRKLEEQLADLPPPQWVYAGSNDFKPDGSFKPAAAPREVQVLERGDITQPQEAARPGALSCVEGLDYQFESDMASEGDRRAALADWLADPRNVLTWRSIANRVWHYHFGRGLVDSPNDFGRMGSAPTHPELLDYLACELLDHSGSLKHLHRLILNSAVYRQSSAHDPAQAELDADNRLLWRMNRTRLDAESIRDAVLQVTGKLDRTMGGPSVKQFIQSPGVHVTPVVDYLGFDPDSPENFRRSVYRFIFRTLPDPFMESLDCADASQLTPARNTSVTALQALAMLNNKFIVRQSEHLAQRVAAEAPQLPDQIDALFRLSLGREPTAEESQAFCDYAARHGLANACRMLLNSNEFMFVN